MLTRVLLTEVLSRPSAAAEGAHRSRWVAPESVAPRSQAPQSLSAALPWLVLLAFGGTLACGSEVADTEAAAGEIQSLSPAEEGLRGMPRFKPKAPRYAPDKHGSGVPKPTPSQTTCNDPCQGGISFQELDVTSLGGELQAYPVALNNLGQVLVSGKVGSAPALFLGGSTALTAVDLAAQGLSAVSWVGLDDAGHLAYLGGEGASRHNLYLRSGAAGAAQTLYDSTLGGSTGDQGALYSWSQFSLAPSGMLAFSSIENGQGGIYRGPATGPFELLRQGSGQFYNGKQIDVNSAGTVTMQMEHSLCTLRRGVLVFSSPTETVNTVNKAIVGLNVGASPDPAINDAGEIAVALSGTLSDTEMLNCSTGISVVATGVYFARPTLLADPPDLTLIADLSGAFSSFGAVELNNASVVVFQAQLDSGGEGIFRGPDAVANRIVGTGDVLGGEAVSSVQLGQLNDRCQLSLTTVGASGRRRAWLVNGIKP